MKYLFPNVWQVSVSNKSFCLRKSTLHTY